MVKVNRTVFLTINRAVAPMVDMPNLVGYSFRSAENALKNANLVAGETSFKPYFAKDAVLEQLYEGNNIAPGTKLPMGSKISLVLGDGIGNEPIPVPFLVGMTYCDARALLRQRGLDFGVKIIESGVTDTCNAFIYRQSPERFDDERKFRHIRPGQLMDVWVQQTRPEIDSIAEPLPPQPE
jgi:beta-lactam-binding protein with PASTA domain